MENKHRKILGLHELISLLKVEKEVISEQMKSYSLTDPDQGRFSVLVRREAAFEKVIKKLQDSIEVERGHGVISENTLNSIRGPEPGRFKDS